MHGNRRRLPFLAAAAAILATGLALGQQDSFNDTFEGADGGRPANWRFDGATGANFWYRDGGRLNTGDGDSVASMTWAVVNTPQSGQRTDARISTEFWMTQTLGQVALATRYVDTENHYAAILKTFRRPGSTQTLAQIDIVKVVDGATTILASAVEPGTIDLPDFQGKVPPAPGHRFDFEASGLDLTAYLDGTRILQARDGELIMGSVALGQFQNQVLFDDVVVTQSGTAGAGRPSGATAAAPEGDVYRLVLLDHGPDKSLADGLAGDLAAYDNVEVINHGDGTFSVHLGKFPTEAAAAQVRGELVGEGYIILDTIKVGTGAAPGAQPGTGTTSDDEFQRMLAEIQRRQSGSATDTTPAATPTPPPPTPAPTPAAQPSTDTQVAQLRQAANEAETRNQLPQAITHWEAIKNLVQEGPAYDEAVANLRRLNEEMRNEQAEADAGGGLPPMVLIGGAVGLVAFLAVVAFVILRNKKKNAELQQKMEAIKKAPPAAPAKAPGAKPAAAAPKPAAPPAPQEAAPAVEVDSSARIRPGTVMPSKERKQPSSQAGLVPPPQPAPVLPAAPPPVPPPAPPPVVPAPAESDGGIKLDFLFEEPATDSEPPTGTGLEDTVLAVPDSPRPGKAKEPSTQFIIPPLPDVAPGAPPAAEEPAEAPAPPAPAVAAAGSPAADGDVFYEQAFDGEETGVKPANWRGDYEYSSLVVVERPDDPTRKCMRFEKKSGVGSAYYSCKFPNASGRIVVEFDMRCDEKNKYLLGFYIERDEDFRQSIHTIVHRTNSSASPTLRIQNEATPYEFGTWTHIKFEIDLPRHIIDGYADGRAIASGVRLNSCPKMINTLSIRDNLATTGVLLIDNIRISKFR